MRKSIVLMLFYGRFSRSFSLPENVDENAISAENREGMLCMHLPKTTEKKPKQIKVDIQ